MGRARVAVALLVPEPVATEVQGLRRALGDGSLVRVAPHITLVPPVNVASVDDAADTVRRAAASVSAFDAVIGPADTFAPVNPVVYLRVTGDGGALGRLREDLFRPPLERRVDHAFVPHVTVGDNTDTDRIPAALAALADYTATVTFSAVHLLVQGDARVWRPVAEAPLGPPDVAGRGGLPLEVAVTTLADADARRVSQWVGFAVTGRRHGRPVGLAEVRLAPGPDGRLVAHLVHLEVVPDHRGEGVATALLARVVDRAAALEAVALVAAHPGPAAAFLAHRGFAPAGGDGGLARPLPRTSGP
ncbi:MAG TPA: GNAT family N-acetyltransferase [Acidimicrobiales bacterium]|nr:GNAT family N-acetyltransferase [Acidimicrobiales bacterium]